MEGNMYHVYILQSKKNHSYYIGHTQDIQIRINRHNEGYVRSTKSGRPWVLVYQELYKSKSAAYKREMQIKSFKGGNAFQALLPKNMPS